MVTGPPGPAGGRMYDMAEYMILIYGDEQRWDAMSAEEMRRIDEGHETFRAKAGAKIVSSGQLESSAKAVTLRPGGVARPMVTDGPFLEGKEVVGGFYVIRAADLDEAVSLASGLAELRQDHTGVQVHPLVDHG